MKRSITPRRPACRSSSRSTRSTSRTPTPSASRRSWPTSASCPKRGADQTVMVEVSAKKKENLELLLEMILLVTELSELKANPKRNASGTVLEAKLDKGRGPVATILVQDGTLHVGDTFIAGTIVGKVRALIDDRGRQIKAAGPATPVEVLGLGGLPAPGDAFQALTDAAKARQIAHFRQSAGEGEGARRQGHAAHARIAAAADRRRRHEGAADHHQGRRAGLGRSARRHADQADRREGQDPHHPQRRRRHQRVRRAAGVGVERDHHRLQRAARIGTPPTSPNARRWTSACTRSSTTSSTR